MGVTVSITGADQRQDQALAKVTRNNQLVTLTASRDLRFLLQEVLEKQMTARGYMIGPNGAVNLQIIVNQLYADGYRDYCDRGKWQQDDQKLSRQLLY